MATTVDRTVAVVRNMRHAARRIDLAGFEQGGRDAIRVQLRPLVERLCEVALAFFEQAEEEDQTAAQDGRLADLGAACFAARLELAQAIGDLRRDPDTRDTWDLLDACNRARGSLVKATLAIERAACALTGLPAPPGTRRDLDLSLAVRSTYAEFRAAIGLAAAADQPRERLLVLRDAVRRIAGAPLYGVLRVADRCALRRLDDRIEATFAREDAIADEDTARLLGEAAGVAEMLMRINDREELREHDGSAVAELLELAQRSGPLAEPDRLRALALLHRLAGRDPDLDRVIDMYMLRDRAPLLQALRSVAARGSFRAGPAAPRPVS